ncbi:two-component system, chemotaxis family, response regulator WspR [Arsukibacterium sp. MJ3]|uniref:sensor domain-containing diguanylate cyclase n=1 Tax=Arsukibacterium sp. MJ3 TaxID=1632859 RepID=UPI0006270567|nr:sensor domain-containing diguanylate cyclase [Arsukibacterium sp. MJ3]KKO49381.1 two-component system, chemotaxis family, response regulator WspR [Arsukibacterium sp. MJ3]
MLAHANSRPHFWNILDKLPVALFYKESAKAEIWANSVAQQLFGFTAAQQPLSLPQLSEIRLLDQQQNKISLLSNPLLLALSGTTLNQAVTLDFKDRQKSLILNSQLVKLEFSLGTTIIVTLCPQQDAPASSDGLAHCAPSAAPVMSNNHYSHTDIAELEEALAFDKLMSLISTELINVSSEALDQHVDDALAALGEFCHADRSYLFQFNQQVTEMNNSHEWVREGISPQKANLQQVPDTALPYFYQKMKQDHIFAVADITQLPAEASNEQQEFNNEDIRSVLCIGMLAENKLLGFVGCDMVARQRHWSSNDVRRIKLVGEMIANSIQNVNYRNSLQQIQQELLAANRELQKQANQDGLTGLANRRQFDEKLLEEIQRSARSALPLSLLMLDIDLFKPFNDHYGHQAGDEALQRVATVLSNEAKRQGEIAARYGGEEFALILPSSDSVACQDVAERVQQQIKALNISHCKSDVAPYLTASMGCFSIIACKNTTAKQMLRKSDEALYQAKAAGRNKVIAAD